MSTSARGVHARRTALCFASRAENVERLCMRSCKSPMSTSTSSNQGKLAISAGMNSPARAIRLASPTAFMAAVLPPVLGPVITTHRVERGTNTSTGTGPRVAGVSSEIDAPRFPNTSASYSSSADDSSPFASARFFFLDASFLAAARRAARRARIACASSTGCLSPASSTSSSFFSASASASSAPSSSSPAGPRRAPPASVGNMAFCSASRALRVASASASASATSRWTTEFVSYA